MKRQVTISESSMTELRKLGFKDSKDAARGRAMAQKSSGYLVSDRNFNIVFLSQEKFAKRFPKPGPNFQTRLKQIQHFLPAAIDWEMLD